MFQLSTNLNENERKRAIISSAFFVLNQRQVRLFLLESQKYDKTINRYFHQQ